MVHKVTPPVISADHYFSLVESLAKDGLIDAVELQQLHFLVDQNQNGATDWNILSTLSTGQFQELSTLLGRHGIAISDLISLPHVEWVSVDAFKPKTSKESLEIEDPRLAKIMRTNATYEDLPFHADKFVAANATVMNHETFRQAVLREAEEMDIDLASLSTMGVNEAIVTVGKIVAHHVQYFTELADKPLAFKKTHSFDEYQKALVAGELAQFNTPQDKKVDGMSADELWQFGRMVCCHYAQLSRAVFSIIKSINPNLNNTYMLYMRSAGDQWDYDLGHAWNMVISVEPTGRFLATFIDTTWAERATDEGEPVFDSSGFDALDDSHFGKNLKYLELYKQSLYNYLSDHHRMNSFSADRMIPEAERIRESGALYLYRVEHAREGYEKILHLLPILQELDQLAFTCPDIFSSWSHAHSADMQLRIWTDWYALALSNLGISEQDFTHLSLSEIIKSYGDYLSPEKVAAFHEVTREVMRYFPEKVTINGQPRSTRDFLNHLLE